MKNTGKLTILMVAVVAIGIFALPSVMSVGTGQHTFNNGTDGYMKCNKCHANPGDGINTELTKSGVTMYAGNVGGTAYAAGDQIHKLDGVGYVKDCRSCHKMAETRTGTSSTDHTNVLLKPSCTGCHTNVDTELNGAISGVNDAHRNLNSTAVGNAGCMGCHTAVRVAGSPSYSYSAGFTNVRGLTLIGEAAESLPGNTQWTP